MEVAGVDLARHRFLEQNKQNKQHKRRSTKHVVLPAIASAGMVTVSIGLPASTNAAMHLKILRCESILKSSGDNSATSIKVRLSSRIPPRIDFSAPRSAGRELFGIH